MAEIEEVVAEVKPESIEEKMAKIEEIVAHIEEVEPEIKEERPEPQVEVVDDIKVLEKEVPALLDGFDPNNDHGLFDEDEELKEDKKEDAEVELPEVVKLVVNKDGENSAVGKKMAKVHTGEKHQKRITHDVPGGGQVVMIK